MKHLFLIAGILASSLAVAQSALSDAKGDSSLLMPDKGGYAQLLFDKSFARIGYIYDVGEKSYYAFDISAKLAGSTGLFASDGKLSPDAKIRLFFGQRLTTPLAKELPNQIKMDELLTQIEKKKLELQDLEKKKSKDRRKSRDQKKIDQLTQEIKLLEDSLDDLKKQVSQDASETPYQTAGLQITGRKASYNLFDPTQPVASQITKESFEGWGVSLVYSALRPSMRYGASIGFLRDNNIDDLDLLDIKDSETFVSGGTTRVLESTTKAYAGNYEVYNLTPLNVDFVYWPQSFKGGIACHLFGRFDLAKKVDDTMGLAIYMCELGAPTKIKGGLSLSFNKGKPTVSLLAGYSF